MRSLRVTRLLLTTLLIGAIGGRVGADVQDLTRPGEVVYVVDAQDRVLVDINGETPFIPASTLKVFTTLLAAQHLGLDEHFTTEFFQDGDRLVIRGNGDPYLVSEELTRIANALRIRLDGKRLARVVVDDSFFVPHLTIPGVRGSANPYDAPNSATSANFNTISVARRNGKLVSAEAQTPLTPLAESLARRYRIRGSARIPLSNNNGEAARYAGELLAAKLRAAGVKVSGGVDAGRAPAEPPLYVHENSRTVGNVCQELLYHSNNYIANQVFLAVGAKVEGAPASLDKSRRVSQRFIAAHPELEEVVVIEGSGLSYDNRVTAPAMAALLKLFAPFRYLLKEKDGVPHKTGTLFVTRTLVGYLNTESHGTVRFVIALDGSKSDRRWQIVEALRQEL